MNADARTIKAAASYLNLGFALVSLKPGQKVPRTDDWQNHPVTAFQQLGEAFGSGRGVGLHHGASGTAVLDIDDLELARIALAAAGIDLDDLLNAPGPKLDTSRSIKPLFLTPPGADLKRHALSWKDESGKVHTVFELRAGLVQEVMPPTIHPDTGKTYLWTPGPPLKREDIPELPGNLRALWEHWAELKPLMDAASPWAKPPAPPPAPRPKQRKEGALVIEAFNEAHNVRELLEAHGYTPRGTDRFVAPDSKTGTPGVVLLKEGATERAYSHHGSDLLGDGHSHDAFSVYTILEHGGDQLAAVKGAAAELGLTSPTVDAPAAKPAPREVVVEVAPDETPRPEVFPEFPLGVFPEAVGRFVEEAAAALPAPTDNLGVAVLAFAGAAIGTSREIEVKPGWREGPRVYAALIALPGSKKSPALSLPARPFHDRQRQAHLEYKQERAAYDTALLQYEQERLAWRAAKSKGEMPTPPTEPTMAQVYTTDATLEALAGLLERNPRGLVLLQDELSAWVNALGQYKGGKGSDRQKFLSFWSGAPEVVNRKGQEPIVLPNPFVNVVGNLPPDILGELSDEQGREDGFIHRILLCYPDPVPLVWTDASVSAVTQSAYSDVFTRLWQLEPETTNTGQVRPRVLRFSEAGRSAFRDWITCHYEEMNAPDFSPVLRGPWAKLEGYAARFALILHCLQGAAGEAATPYIDETSVYGAAALADYFKAHARRAYAALHATALEKQAEAVLAYIERQPGRRISLRDLVRSGAGKVRDQKGARAVLEHLRTQSAGEFVTLSYSSGQKGDGFELSK